MANVTKKMKTASSNGRKNKSRIWNQKTDYAEQLETQLKMAGAVQRDFLPRSLPDNDKFNWSVSFMPADWVSGDIYDITRLDEEHIGFYLADAVGHSIPAALLTMFIKQAIVMRETTGHTYKIFTPLEVINNLNKKMCEQQLSGCQFATCCYCLLNTKTLRLDYCRAGHPYPLIINSQNNVSQLQSKGALLGVFDNAQFEQGSTQLKTGDKLILYSDGAEPLMGIEQNDSNLNFHREFGELLGLPGRQLTAKFEELSKATKNPAEVDDISVIVLEINK
jgi:sigma-B regulation protein RsbU (phosphoserine phosphatase)